jgi:hypothetical protein
MKKLYSSSNRYAYLFSISYLLFAIEPIIDNNRLMSCIAYVLMALFVVSSLICYIISIVKDKTVFLRSLTSKTPSALINSAIGALGLIISVLFHSGLIKFWILLLILDVTSISFPAFKKKTNN